MNMTMSIRSNVMRHIRIDHHHHRIDLPLFPRCSARISYLELV